MTAAKRNISRHSESTLQLLARAWEVRVYVDKNGNPVAGAGGKLGSEKTSSSSENGSSGPSREPAVEHHGVTGGLTPRHREAIKRYTGASYRQVNGHLVGGTAASPETTETIAALDDVMSRASLPAPKTVYRGMGSLAVKSVLDQTGGKPKKGQTITFSGFTSTSDDAAVAKRFASQSNIGIFTEIKLPAGCNAADVSKYSDTGSDEKETLVARGASFKVLSYDPKSKKLALELIMKKQDKKPKPTQDAAAASETPMADTDRFAWHDGAGLKVEGEGEGDVLFTYSDFGLEEGK